MNNTLLNILRKIYFISLFLFLIIYLYPGSIIGYIFYGNLKIQPDLIKNPLGTSINHILAFIYISLIAFVSASKEKLRTNIYFIFSLAFFLEFTHLFIPQRSFELLDLVGNIFGVTISFLMLLLVRSIQR